MQSLRSRFGSRPQGEITIERCAGVPYEVFRREYIYRRRPVILTDSIEPWRSLSRWTPEFFRSEFGNRRVPVGDELITMGDLVERVLQSSEGDPAPYLMGTGTGRYLGDLFPELLADIEPRPAYLQPNWLEDRFYSATLTQLFNRGPMAEIFFGGRGARFPVLHWDFLAYHAFAFQIYGTKEWILYPPSDSENLYPRTEMPNQSRVPVLENPDLTRFPRFAAANARHLVLRPGETLFLPWGWWHTTRLTGPSISVSINLANASNWGAVVYWLVRSQESLRPALVFSACLAAHRVMRALR